MCRLLLLTVALLIGFTTYTFAQNEARPDTVELIDITADTTVSNAHYRAVKAFLDENKAMFYESIYASFDNEFRQNPELQPLLPLIRNYIEKTMEWKEIAPQLIFMYMDIYTKEEIEELAEFMRTDIGQKLATHTPEFIRKFQQIGLYVIMDNRDELEMIINQYFDEN